MPEINALTAIASLALSDIFHVNDADNSNASRKATIQQIFDLFANHTITLTGKIISGSNNTFSNIPQSAITDLITDLASKLEDITGENLADLADIPTPSANLYLRRNSGDTAYEWATASGGSGEPSDGDKGDITVSSSGTIWTVDNSVISNTKLSDMLQNRIKGRITASTGAPEDLTPANVRTMINVEDGATADQTGSEIKSLYESEADTNAFTDAEKTLLGNQSGTNTGDEPDASTTVKGIVELATNTEVNTGTDATRAITPDALKNSSLQSKIDGIESGATADQSDSEIETAYNNQVSIVSQAEAETGTATTVRRWTAERVAQAIAALAGSSGQSNTASNVGTGGVGVFKQKTGVDLEFKKINAGSAKITITDDTGDDEVDINIVTGTDSNSVCIGNDARLSDTRTPTDLSVSTGKIIDSNVTYAKIQDVSATDRLLGRNTTGAGIVEEITPSQIRTMINVADGATVNSSDATLLARANHTGTQTASTISDYASATAVFTNKSIDEDGTGNAITNLDTQTLKTGSSILNTTIAYLIDGSGSPYSTGIKPTIRIEHDCTITGVTLLNSVSDTVQIDINRYTSLSNYNAGTKASLTASAQPSTSSAKSSEDVTLTGWTTTLSEGDILEFEVDTAPGSATWTSIVLNCVKT